MNENPFGRLPVPFDLLDDWKSRFEPSSTCLYLTTMYRFGPNMFGLFFGFQLCGRDMSAKSHQ